LIRIKVDTGDVLKSAHDLVVRAEHPRGVQNEFRKVARKYLVPMVLDRLKSRTARTAWEERKRAVGTPILTPSRKPLTITEDGVKRPLLVEPGLAEPPHIARFENWRISAENILREPEPFIQSPGGDFAARLSKGAVVGVGIGDYELLRLDKHGIRPIFDLIEYGREQSATAYPKKGKRIILYSPEYNAFVAMPRGMGVVPGAVEGRHILRTASNTLHAADRRVMPLFRRALQKALFTGKSPHGGVHWQKTLESRGVGRFRWESRFSEG